MNVNNELTRNDIAIDPDMEIEYGIDCIVTVYIETWFDVDKKFGIHTANDDDTWVNFYAKYYTESGELLAEYQIDRSTGDEWHNYTPTENEKKLIIGMMEECCQKHHGCNLKEYCQETTDFEMGGIQ